MTNEEIKDLIGIREYVISEFRKLDGRQNPGTSVMKQTDVANVYTEVVKNLDFMLKEYVKFE